MLTDKKLLALLCMFYQYVVFAQWMLCCPVGFVERGAVQRLVVLDSPASLPPLSHETGVLWLHWPPTGVPMAGVLSCVDSRVLAYIDSCAGTYIVSRTNFVLLNARLNLVRLDARRGNVELLAAGLLEPVHGVAAVGFHIVDHGVILHSAKVEAVELEVAKLDTVLGAKVEGVKSHLLGQLVAKVNGLHVVGGLHIVGHLLEVLLLVGADLMQLGVWPVNTDLLAVGLLEPRRDVAAIGLHINQGAVLEGVVPDGAVLRVAELDGVLGGVISEGACGNGSDLNLWSAQGACKAGVVRLSEV